MTFQPTPRQLSAIKAALFLLTLLPALHYAHGLWSDSLGANPIEALTRGMGIWTLNFLFLTLCVSPLRKLSGWHWLLRLRRQLGLTAFAYGVLHFLAYVWLDQFWDLDAIARDILKRPFITLGFAAFVLLWPLALTSNQRAIRHLGGKRWQELHRMVYAIAILGVAHYLWLVKRVALLDPILYAIALAVLLGWRIQARLRLAGPWPVRSAPPVVQPVVFMPKRPQGKLPLPPGH